MPTPKSGEKEQEFVSRCMGDSDMQKYDQDQRAAICFSKFRSKSEKKSSEAIKRKSVFFNLKKLEKILFTLVNSIEKKEIRKGIILEIPQSVIGSYSEEGQILFKSIYFKNRLSDKNMEKSLNLAKNFLDRENKVNKGTLLKMIQKELSKIVKARKEDKKKVSVENDVQSVDAIDSMDEVKQFTGK